MKVIVLGNIDKNDFLTTSNELLRDLERYDAEIIIGETEYNHLLAHQQYLRSEERRVGKSVG